MVAISQQVSQEELAVLLGAKYPDSEVVLDTVFKDGLSGFGQLVATTSPVGMLNWEPAYPGGLDGGGALVLCSGNQADGALDTAPMGEASAYRRLTRYMAAADESMTVSLEVWWAWQARYGKTRFRAFEFGFDQCYADGTRLFPVYRWLNSDDGTDARRDCKWYVQTGNDAAPAYTLLPGPDTAVQSATFEASTANIQTKLPFNENKRNLNYCRGDFIFNADKTVRYKGLKVNHRGFGSLAATPDSTFEALGPTSSALADFSQGFNVSFSVRNRTNATKTAARVYIARVRVTVL